MIDKEMATFQKLPPKSISFTRPEDEMITVDKTINMVDIMTLRYNDIAVDKTI